MRNHPDVSRPQRGFSMIEVLVTLVILAMAMLGSAGLQAYAMKTGQGGQFRNQAAFLVADMVERMEANKTKSVSASGYASALSSSVDCSSNSCSPDDLAAYDVTQWKAAILAVLPEGTGTVTQTAAGNPSTYTVTINWVDRKTNAQYSSATAAGATESFSITTTRTIGY